MAYYNEKVLFYKAYSNGNIAIIMIKVDNMVELALCRVGGGTIEWQFAKITS